jgi:hypothetical protein
MTMLHHIYTVTHIYIIFKLLFIPFFTLLPLFWAGQMAQTLLVCHRKDKGNINVKNEKEAKKQEECLRSRYWLVPGGGNKYCTVY